MKKYISPHSVNEAKELIKMMGGGKIVQCSSCNGTGRQQGITVFNTRECRRCLGHSWLLEIEEKTCRCTSS